jgi:hypothetical protein
MQDLEERERQLQLENDQFRQRLDLDDSAGNPDAARLRIEVIYGLMVHKYQMKQPG